MAPAPVARLATRALSHGAIAGAVVGSLIGAFLLLTLLTLPFILRAIRDIRHGRKPFATGHDIDTVDGPPGFHVPGEPVSGRGPQPSAGSRHDSNSFDDGKARAPYSPTAVTSAATAAPGYNSRSALPAGAAMINTAGFPAGLDATSAGGPGAYTAAQRQLQPPVPVVPFLASPPQQQQQRSFTLESSNAPSFVQTIASIFRRTDTHSSLSRTSSGLRSPVETSRSPVELQFGEFDSSSNQMWMPAAGPVAGPGAAPMGYQQPPYPTEYPSEAPALYTYDEQHLTGASAEYYSGAPLSPPSDPNSPAAGLGINGVHPGALASSLASMGSAAAIAAAPTGARQPKLAALRTDSLRTAASGAEFSPLSPTSPPRAQDALSDAARGMDDEDGDGKDHQQRAIPELSTPPPKVSASLSPEPADFPPVSPSFRPLVPSPRLPAPGTVNPRDVWAPATDDERFTHVTAELDRFEPSIGASPATVSDYDGSQVPSDNNHESADTEVEAEAGVELGQSTKPGSEYTAVPEFSSNLPTIETVTTPEVDCKSQHAPDVELTGTGSVKMEALDDRAYGAMDGSALYQEPDMSAVSNHTMTESTMNGNGGYTMGYGSQLLSPSTNLAQMSTDVQQSNPDPWAAYTYMVQQTGLPDYPNTFKQENMPGLVLVTPPTGPLLSNGSVPPYPTQQATAMIPGQLFPSESQYRTATAQAPMIPQQTISQLPSQASSPSMAPITPPQQRQTPYSTPLLVPVAGHAPASPMSTLGSTPGHQSTSSLNGFRCNECGREFDQVHKLNHHKRYHERPHECAMPNCGKRFGTKTHLDRHINDKHSKSRKYHCTEDGCPYSVPGGKSFPRKDNWRRHMVNKHGVQPEHDPIEVVDEPMAGM